MTKEETYIDRFDIEILETWLRLAKTKGTKAIRIVTTPVEVQEKYGATHLVTIDYREALKGI